MKKFLFTSIGMFSALLALSQQALYLEATVMDSSYAQISGHPVWINQYSNGNFISQQTLYSDTLGKVYYTAPALPNAMLEAITNDCNGRLYTISNTPSLLDSSFFDSLIIGCGGIPSSIANCGGSLVQQTTSGNNVVFSTSGSSTSLHNAQLVYSWIFGDGGFAVSYDQDSISHQYAAGGTYQACVVINIRDTLRNITYCADTSCVIFNLSGSSSSFCTSQFQLDTSSSGGQGLVLYNISTPAHNNTNYSTSYNWSFGDGSTSSMAFPSHQYTSYGLYEVCLTVSSVDGSQNVCTDTYCDSLGVDSLGNVLYKNSFSAFTLQVLNPSNALGAEQHKLNTRLRMYPNPTKSDVILNGFNDSGAPIRYQVLSLGGKHVLQGVQYLGAEKEIRINVEPLSDGIYQLHLQHGTEVGNLKLMVY